MANRWSSILSSRLEEKEKTTLLEGSIYPENVPQLKSPTLNVELTALTNQAALQRDRIYCSRQEQLGKGIFYLGTALNLLLEKEVQQNSVKHTELIKSLSIAGKL